MQKFHALFRIKGQICHPTLPHTHTNTHQKKPGSLLQGRHVISKIRFKSTQTSHSSPWSYKTMCFKKNIQKGTNISNQIPFQHSQTQVKILVNNCACIFLEIQIGQEHHAFFSSCLSFHIPKMDIMLLPSCICYEYPEVQAGIREHIVNTNLKKDTNTYITLILALKCFRFSFYVFHILTCPLLCLIQISWENKHRFLKATHLWNTTLKIC